MSSRADTERDEVVSAGFIAGMRIGKALIRNLYKEVKVPLREVCQIHDVSDFRPRFHLAWLRTATNPIRRLNGE